MTVIHVEKLHTGDSVIPQLHQHVAYQEVQLLGDPRSDVPFVVGQTKPFFCQTMVHWILCGEL